MDPSIVIPRGRACSILVGYRPAARSDYSRLMIPPQKPAHYKTNEALQKWSAIEQPQKLAKQAEKAAYSALTGAIHSLYAVDPVQQQVFTADSPDKVAGFWPWLKSIGYCEYGYRHAQGMYNMPRIVAFDPKCLLSLLWRAAVESSQPDFFGDVFDHADLFDPRWPLLSGGSVDSDEINETELAILAGISPVRLPMPFTFCQDPALDTQILAGLMIRFKMNAPPTAARLATPPAAESGERVSKKRPAPVAAE